MFLVTNAAPTYWLYAHNVTNAAENVLTYSLIDAVLGVVHLHNFVPKINLLDASSDMSEQTSALSLGRLLEGAFAGDFAGFQEYCRQEESWTAAVKFLDEKHGAGWGLIEGLCLKRGSVSLHLASPLFKDLPQLSW